MMNVFEFFLIKLTEENVKCQCTFKTYFTFNVL